MAQRLLSAALLLCSASAFPVYDSVHGDHPINNQEIKPNWPVPKQYGGANGSAYFSPAFVPHGEKLDAALPQTTTNGNSLLGTLDAPKLPMSLPNTAADLTARDFSYPGPGSSHCGSMPNTGVTRYYTFNIAAQNIAPDGVVRSGMTINGGFPGPTIQANWGDWIQVTVNNNLQDEGTSIHWHGLLQIGTPYMDGVPGVSQCPIAPGKSVTYKFRADSHGTSWYHAHYSAQYSAGLLGAMIIYGPTTNAQYDADLGPIILSDWYHPPYFNLVEQTMAPASAHQFPVTSSNSLINGKMNFPCSQAAGYQCTPNAGISKFQIQSGKSYRLRLINAGAEGIQKFSIDGYMLKVIANDFIPVVPYMTQVVTLGVGQRTDVILTANGKPTDSMWMRADLGKSAFVGGCTLNDGVSPLGVAAMYYQNANTSSVPTTNYTVPQSVINNCANDPLSQTQPSCSQSVATPSQTQTLGITYQSNGTHNLFFVNNSTFRADYNAPTLLMAKAGNTSFPAESNVYRVDSGVLRLVVYNYALTGAHPMHLHGHNYQVLAVGNGTWNGIVTNPGNPQQRDVQLLPNAVSATTPSYIVLQFQINNPGVWPFHCHIAWHVSSGLYVNILEAYPALHYLRFPSATSQTCRDWATWTGSNIPDEIDSGL